MTDTPHIAPGLLSVSTPYPCIFLDAYGVFWGGNDYGLIPGSKEAMEQLVRSGKVVGIVSNTTQIVSQEIEKFRLHGLLQGKHFHFVVTAGELLRHLLMTHALPLQTPRKSYWILGANPTKSSGAYTIFKDTAYTRVTQPEEADFGYISLPQKDGEDQTDPELFRADLHAIMSLHLPLICANPDLFAHEGMPPRPVVRQGSLARMYLEMGGEVLYIGKPYPLIYNFALDHCRPFNITDIKKILMVGDTPETDVRGALGVGMDSALIVQSTGIMADRAAFIGLRQALNKLPVTDIPTYLIAKL